MDPITAGLQGVTTQDLEAALVALGDDDCACSSAPTPCVDCQQYDAIVAELGRR